jgi:hypothetical protein
LVDDHLRVEGGHRGVLFYAGEEVFFVVFHHDV